MAEWLYEAGIGEARAALIEQGRLIEAQIEPEGESLRVADHVVARLVSIEIPGRRGIARLDSGEEALLTPLPAGVTQGARCQIEITRTALGEPGKPKRAKARPSDAPLARGPDLRARIEASGFPVQALGAYDADAFEAAGWSEWLEVAATGVQEFAGGALRLSLTPAMSLIDIDGLLEPAPLALAGARAAGQMIRVLDLQGSIGIDFPTLGGKAERLATAEALDAMLALPFERTAVNGFGFLQLIRPRHRASLAERLRDDPLGCGWRALLRRAQRSGLSGATRLAVNPAMAEWLEAQPGNDWLDRLGRQLGGSVGLRVIAGLGIAASRVESQNAS